MLAQARTAVVDSPCTYVVRRPADDAHASHGVDADSSRLGCGDDDGDQDWSDEFANQIDAPHGSVKMRQIVDRGGLVRDRRGEDGDPVPLYADHVRDAGELLERAEEDGQGEQRVLQYCPH